MAADLRRRLILLLGVRVIVSTLLLGSAVVFRIGADEPLPSDPFFFLIGLTYALSVLYALSLRFVARHRWLIEVQFACDALTISAIVHFTGGITSFFPLLYVLPIIGAGILQFRTGGLRLALIASSLYGGIVLLQYLGAQGYVAGRYVADMAGLLPPVRVAQYTVATHAGAFFLVAVLSGSLAEGLRTAGASLERASSELAGFQAFSQHVVDSLMSGLVTTDYHGRIRSFNRAAESITLQAAPSVIGTSVAETLQLPTDFAHLLKMDLGGTRSRRVDYTFRTSQGEGIEVGLTATHLVTPDGRAGFLLTFQDTTEIRRLEREGRRRQRLAAVGEMAAGIAHEIRNPLASMRGSIQILRRELTLNDEQAQLMDIVLRESDRLNDTIQSFLNYARPQRAATTRFDLGTVLGETALLLRNNADVSAAHSVEVDVAPTGVWYEADEGQIRQIVWNLATNGLKAMPEGGRLTLCAREEAGGGAAAGATLVLEVQDQGVGIPPERLDGIFQPFQGTFTRGSGLGLAIVHRIVTDHHGEIRIASTPGTGTTVRVFLPPHAAAGAAA
jgi:two-component system, NtrC family, sensor histidine kinase PilS